MNARIVSECTCNVCNAGVQEVYDAPVFGGRWGYICRKCVAMKNVDIHTGTYLRTEAGKPYWCTEEIHMLLFKVVPYLTREGVSYFMAMDRAWCQYGEAGLQSQIPYLLSNLKDECPEGIKTELEELRFVPQP